MPHANTSQPDATETAAEVVQEILRAIEQLRFGSVEITVHEGRVTQIERREKIRFNQPSAQDNLRFTPTANTAAKL